MNRKILAWLLGIGLATCFFSYSLHFSPPDASPRWAGTYVSKKSIRTMPASIGNGEDLSGRDYYDWMRLREPGRGIVPSGIRERELLFAKKLPARTSNLLKGEVAGGQDVTWAQRGPYNVGGRTRALGVDARNPLIMLSGGVSGGMWRSTNGGNSWQKVAPLNDIQSTTCLVQDLRSGREDTWYYGTGELKGNSASSNFSYGIGLYRGDGIFKSTDNGVTWTKLASTETNDVFFNDHPFDYVWNIALSRTDVARDIVVASTIGTIQTSTDGGQSWATTLGSTINNAGSRYTDVISTSEGVFYATKSSRNINGQNMQALDRGIWRSVDGISWTNILPASWPTVYNRIVAAAAPSDENIVYFLAETPGTGPTGHMLWQYTYTSGDGSGSGGIWEDRSASLPQERNNDDSYVMSSQASYDLVVAVSPVDPDVVFVGGVNLFRSDDGGRTQGGWHWIGGYQGVSDYRRYLNNHPDHHVLVFHPLDPTILFNGNDGGVFKSTNATTSFSPSWTVLNRGYYTTQFYTVALDPGTPNDATVVGGMQDNGTWYTSYANAAIHWTEFPGGGDGSYCAIEPGGDALYFSVQNGVTYRTTRSDIGRIDPAGGSGYLFINPFMLDPANSDRMYMIVGSTIWVNTKLSGIPTSLDAASANWVKLQQTSVTGDFISALGMSKNPEGILYYGTYAGRVFRLPDAHSGTSSPEDLWTGSGFPSGGYVSSISVDPLDANHVLIAFSNYGIPSIFATTDGGLTWVDVSGNLEDQADGSGNGPSVRWVAMLPDSADYYYFAGTSTGLYATRSLDGAATVWMHEGTESIGYSVVDMIAVRPTDGYVVVGTHGRGVFSASIPVVEPTLPSEPPPVPVPLALEISRNYPNPFNAGTAVTVSLPSAEQVTVEVYDIRGRLVNRIADGVFPAGISPPIVWNGNNHDASPSASGIYLLVARSSTMLSVTKAMLVR